MVDIEMIKKRKEPFKQRKYKTVQEGSNVVRAVKKFDYEYFICDYCGNRFKVQKKWEQRDGGILEYPMTPYSRIKVALCNGCLKPAIEELDELRKRV